MNRYLKLNEWIKEDVGNDKTHIHRAQSLFNTAFGVTKLRHRVSAWRVDRIDTQQLYGN